MTGWKELKWDTKPNVEAGHHFIRGSEMWNRTKYVPSSRAGKPGRTAYGSQLEEWKAAGLDGFRMLHMSNVKVVQYVQQLLHHVQRCFSWCAFLFQTSPCAPLTVSQHVTPLHLCSQTCLATPTSFFGALCLLLGSLHKARDEGGCLPSLSSHE